MENEEWRPVVGYEQFYEVSSLGRVRSFDREVNGKYGNVAIKKGKLIQPMFSHGKYHQVNLYCNGKNNTQKVHRLVAKAFLPNPNNYDQVNHKNLIKTDNRVENLEWCSARQNMHHMMDNGKMAKGEGKKLAKLNESQVIEIRRIHSENMCAYRVKRGLMQELSRRYNVSVSLIEKVVHRVNWKHI